MFTIDADATANRYDLSKFMASSGTNFFDVVDSKFLYKLKSLAVYGTYTVTTEEGRPDLISERIYGFTYHQYWWILMIMNDLRSPVEIVSGMKIKYPSLSDLETLYFSLTSNTSTSTSSTTTTVTSTVTVEKL